MATLYRHFDSKEKLVLAVAERACRQDGLLMKRLLDAERPLNRSGTLESIILERLEDYVSPKEARLRIELWAEALHDPDLRALLRRGLEEVEESFRAASGRKGAATTDAHEPIGLFQGALLRRALGIAQSSSSPKDQGSRAKPVMHD